MSNRPGAWQRRRPHKRPKALHQACPGMRPEFSTLLLTMEGSGVEEEEEDSPHLVADSPTSRWLHQASPITQWGHLGAHRQHLAQGVLVW